MCGLFLKTYKLKKMNTKLTVKSVFDKILTFDLSTLIIPSSNKGLRGQSLEKLLEIPSSSKLTDLEDGELKTFTFGSTICITQIKHCLSEIINDFISFEDSKLGQKLKQVIFVSFSKKNDYLGSVITSNETHPDIYRKISEDYNFICNKIREIYYKKEQLRTITGPNKILQIRTKSSWNPLTKEYPRLIFNEHTLKNKYMAFYLCSYFGKNIF
jgi:hypothetical protein